jgi:inhibitor of cysteine peptidase
VHDTMKLKSSYWMLVQMIRAYAIYILITMLLLSGCSAIARRPTMSSLVLTEKDKGKAITVHQGDQIVINLQENPTTGYRWAVDKIDNAIIPDQVGYTQSPSGSIGSGGRRSFAFEAKGLGTAHLQLKLWREWEGDASIIDRFDVTIQIQK